LGWEADGEVFSKRIEVGMRSNTKEFKRLDKITKALVDVDNDPMGERAIAKKHRLPSLRSSTFFKILKELGCEIRFGKGSEITVYREGGKKSCIGHHKANHHILSRVMHLNISTQELFAAMGRN
jgi:hypothetical protein